MKIFDLLTEKIMSQGEVDEFLQELRGLQVADVRFFDDDVKHGRIAIKFKLRNSIGWVGLKCSDQENYTKKIISAATSLVARKMPPNYQPTFAQALKILEKHFIRKKALETLTDTKYWKVEYIDHPDYQLSIIKTQ